MTKTEAISLMENGKHEEAYNAFNDLYLANKKDYEALYFRALIDFIHLKNNFEQTLADFELLATVNHNYLVNTLHILTAIYDEFNEYDNVIRIAPKAITEIKKMNTDPKFLLLPYFALARAYYHSDQTEDLETALKYINQGLELMTDEPDSDYYWLKTDILILLKRFDEVEEVITEMINKMPNEPVIYFSKARLASEKGYDLIHKGDEEVGKKLLLDALDYLDIYENYATNEFVQDIRIDVLLELDRSEDALKLIDDSINADNKEEKTMKKINLLCRLDREQDAIKVCHEYLKTNDSSEIKYFLAKLLFNQDNATLADCEMAKTIIEETYQNHHNEKVLLSLCIVYNKLGLYKEAYDEIISFYGQSITNGRMAYFLAELASKLNFSYDLQEYYYTIAYQDDYITHLDYLTIVNSITSHPRNIDKALSKYLKLSIEDLSPWTCYDFGCIYLYGNSKVKPNLDKAYQYFYQAMKKAPDVSCFVTALGRVYELKQDYEQMIKYYHQAHQLNIEKAEIDCVCTFGYLAHAYLNGLGVDKDVNKAKQLILDAVKIKGLDSGNNVSYLYAYFALNNESGFDLDYAYQLLLKQKGFNRYEISRYIILKQLCQVLKQDSSKFDEAIKDCLKLKDCKIKQYYKENINKKVSYPHFKHF